MSSARFAPIRARAVAAWRSPVAAASGPFFPRGRDEAASRRSHSSGAGWLRSGRAERLLLAWRRQRRRLGSLPHRLLDLGRVASDGAHLSRPAMTESVKGAKVLLAQPCPPCAPGSRPKIAGQAAGEALVVILDLDELPPALIAALALSNFRHGDECSMIRARPAASPDTSSAQGARSAIWGDMRWRPRPESNRGARICSPLRHHSATWPFLKPLTT